MHLPAIATGRPVLTGLLAVSLALGACSSGTTPAPSAAPTSAAAPSAAATAPSSAATSPAAGGMAVTIKDFAFGPASLTVPVGSKVTWTNQDSAGHTVTADDGSFASQTIPTGTTFSQTFSTAGSFAYHCSIHKSMKATIVVK
ncbi:MAG: cupredoxin domain-containing protein [Candidatus Limnocylindrales bacterium]